MSASVATTPAEPPSVLELAQTTNPSGGLTVSSSTLHGLDLWVENFRKYEATLVLFSIRIPNFCLSEPGLARGHCCVSGN